MTSQCIRQSWYQCETCRLFHIIPVHYHDYKRYPLGLTHKDYRKGYCFNSAAHDYALLYHNGIKFISGGFCKHWLYSSVIHKGKYEPPILLYYTVTYNPCHASYWTWYVDAQTEGCTLPYRGNGQRSVDILFAGYPLSHTLYKIRFSYNVSSLSYRKNNK